MFFLVNCQICVFLAGSLDYFGSPFWLRSKIYILLKLVFGITSVGVALHLHVHNFDALALNLRVPLLFPSSNFNNSL